MKFRSVYLQPKGMAFIVYKTYAIAVIVASIHANGGAIDSLSKPRF